MTEEETTIYGYTSRTEEFNQNEQEGVRVGSHGGGGDCPSITLILTENKVYGVHGDTRDILLHTDINFEYQWYDEDGEPVDDDDPTGVRGEPTQPKDGAVEDAIEETRHKVRGFKTGWSLRHNSGPEYDNIQEYADDLEEIQGVEVVRVFGQSQEIRANIEIPNEDWGLPGDVYIWIDDHPTFEISDFSNISEGSVDVILDRDKSRASKY